MIHPDLHIKTHRKAAASLLMSDTNVMSVADGATSEQILQIFHDIENRLNQEKV